MTATDPHREWFDRFRRRHSAYGMALKGRLPARDALPLDELEREADRLRRRIAMTEATTKDGLLAQAMLLAYLTRDKQNGHLARALVAGIERLVPEG